MIIKVVRLCQKLVRRSLLDVDMISEMSASWCWKGSESVRKVSH